MLPMEFKTTIITHKDFSYNNLIDWEFFLDVRLNPIELQKGGKGKKL